MDKEQVIELLKKYSKRIQEYFNVDKIVLYGSYSRGEQNEWSDIDVAVFLNEIENDIITEELKLYKLTQVDRLGKKSNLVEIRDSTF